MEKIKINDEIDGLIHGLISDHLIHHTCQIFIRKKGKMKPYASGVLSYLGENYYILTASHVTDYYNDNPTENLYIRVKKGYTSIIGGLRETDITGSDNIDLAYIKLDNSIIDDLLESYKFVPISKFRGHTKLLDSAQYCVIGFPVKNQKIENGRLRTGASFYIMQPCKNKVYNYYQFDSSIFRLLEFKGLGIDLETGNEKKIKGPFYGLSGCGLWLILLYSDGQSYSVDYRLIGIMTEFRNSKYYCMIGNRIEIILDGLKMFENYKYKEINPA
jgi:hypothetical protein